MLSIIIIIKVTYTIVSPSMIEEKPVGRRYRNMIECDIYVKDWNTFKESWKSTDFIKKWSDLAQEDLISQIHLCFDELLDDSKKLCYLFPDSLRSEYQEEMNKILQSPKYFQYLDSQYQALFLGKKKQFLIYKKRSSAVPYLAKYRPPENYKKKFEAIQEFSANYQKLLIERNLVISIEGEKQDIEKCTQVIVEFKKEGWDKALKQYSKILCDMMKDFKKQDKKTEIPLVAISSLLMNQVKILVQKQGLFVSNRYTNISEQQELKDIIITKESRQYSNPSFDDDSLNSNLSDSDSDDQKQEEKQQKQEPPKDIDSVIITNLTSNGPEFHINIMSFGTKRPTEKIQITQLYPQQTQQQKNFLKQLEVTAQKLEYTVILPYLNDGLTTYSFRAVSKIGKSRSKVIQVWNNVKTSQLPLKMSQQDKNFYMLGQNQEGLIVAAGQKNDPNVIFKSTQQKWIKMKVACAEFSISSHVVVCNSIGDVAGWGKMYYFNEGEPTNNPNKVSKQKQALLMQKQDIQKSELPVNTIIEEQNLNEDQFGYFSPIAYQILEPQCLLDNKYIRKVSCGEGYCLMADSFGNVWSFGVNQAGQLGLGQYDIQQNTQDPVMIPSFQDSEIFITDVVASRYGASFALTNKGVVYRWGSDQMQKTQFPVENNFNNVINYQYYGLKTAQPFPLKISKNILTEPVASIHAGFDFVLFLTTERNLYGCGKCEMLGKGKIQDAHSNVIQYLCNPIEIMKSVNAVSVGNQHCLVLKDDNTLVGWGNTRNFEKNGKKFVNTPQRLREDFKGDFVCGPDFTVFHCSESEIEVIGRQDIFKKGKYELPFPVSKIKTGDGVIVIME